MRLNERQNLVIPLYRDGADPYAWVHSTPISREVFEANWVLLSKTFAAIHAEGLGEIAGPCIASLALRDTANAMTRDGDGALLTTPILNEIRRLSNAILATPQGWDTIPMQEALSRNLLDQDDVTAVEAGLVFFTLGWHLYPRNQRQNFMDGAATVWGARMQLLNCTAFAASLAISTATVSSGTAPLTGAATVTAADGTVSTLSLPS